MKTETIMKATIQFELDSDDLQYCDDDRLASLWHIAQANPAGYGDVSACDIAEEIGREIIRRWLAATPPVLWNHQGRHIRDVSASALPAYDGPTSPNAADQAPMPSSLSAQCLSTARPRDGITDDPYNACHCQRA
jgi:hypothetical protein